MNNFSVKYYMIMVCFLKVSGFISQQKSVKLPGTTIVTPILETIDCFKYLPIQRTRLRQLGLN